MKAPDKFRITLTGTTIDVIKRVNAGGDVGHYLGQLVLGTDLPPDIFQPWYLGVVIVDAPELTGPISMHELARLNAYVEIACTHCARRATFSAKQLSEICRQDFIASDLRDLGRQMRCDVKSGGCGKRGAAVRPTDWRPPS